MNISNHTKYYIVDKFEEDIMTGPMREELWRLLKCADKRSREKIRFDTAKEAVDAGLTRRDLNELRKYLDEHSWAVDD